MSVGADGALDGTHHGSTYGTDLAVQVFGMVHNPYGFLVHNHLLGVCLVLGEVFHINVEEVTQAGMQGDVGKVNTLDFHTLHQLAAEVQAGGRRRNSSFVACKNRLETFGIVRLYGTVDDAVGQRRFAQRIERLLELIVRTEVVLSITSATMESSSPK